MRYTKVLQINQESFFHTIKNMMMKHFTTTYSKRCYLSSFPQKNLKTRSLRIAFTTSPFKISTPSFSTFSQLKADTIPSRWFSTQSAFSVKSPFSNSLSGEIEITNTKASISEESDRSDGKILKAACGDVNENENEEDEMEEMFVDAFDGFIHEKREWGGPTRGGRLPEPTRYGDWERKGRCTDF